VIGTKNRIFILRINLGDSLNFFWIFFFGFGYYRCGGRYRLLLQFFKVSLGIINFKYQIVDLSL
jgi:hypothetical protein